MTSSSFDPMQQTPDAINESTKVTPFQPSLLRTNDEDVVK